VGSSLNILADYDEIDEQPNDEPVRHVLTAVDWHKTEYCLPINSVARRLTLI